jgi:sucrose-6-phosphate hydrolase SacC (GH32 family)
MKPEVYTERYRPQFHYTAKTGWINDPIGLVHYEGEYHIFNDN